MVDAASTGYRIDRIFRERFGENAWHSFSQDDAFTQAAEQDEPPMLRIDQNDSPLDSLDRLEFVMSLEDEFDLDLDESVVPTLERRSDLIKFIDLKTGGYNSVLPTELSELIACGGPYSVSTEALMQGGVRRVLLQHEVPFREEYRICARDRFDFFVDGCICVELKVKGQARSIVRQLERYAEHDQVKAIVVVTNKAFSVGEAINGKPVFIVNVGRQWL